MGKTGKRRKGIVLERFAARGGCSRHELDCELHIYCTVAPENICFYTWQNVHKVSSSYIEYGYPSFCVMCSKSDIATCPDRPLTKV